MTKVPLMNPHKKVKLEYEYELNSFKFLCWLVVILAYNVICYFFFSQSFAVNLTMVILMMILAGRVVRTVKRE